MWKNITSPRLLGWKSLFKTLCHPSTKVSLFLFSVDTDECALYAPCMNGGTCTNTAGGYICICPPQWRGDNCLLGKFKCDINVISCKMAYCHCVLYNPCMSRSSCETIFVYVLHNGGGITAFWVSIIYDMLLFLKIGNSVI